VWSWRDHALEAPEVAHGPTPEYCSRLPTIEEADVKVVHCPCGKDVQGETDDLLVEAVEAHIASDHPEMAGKYSREQILGMAHEH
jgi:hypothetical protein